MPVLMIKCPKTGKEVPTGVAMDQMSFRTAKLSNNSVGCPHCGGSHVWGKKDVINMPNV